MIRSLGEQPGGDGHDLVVIGPRRLALRLGVHHRRQCHRLHAGIPSPAALWPRRAAQVTSPPRSTRPTPTATPDHSSALATLTGDNPDTAGDYTFTCSGSCSLSASTTYWLVMCSASGGYTANLYNLTWTASDNQTNTPSYAGWSIGDAAKSGLTDPNSNDLPSWSDVSPADSFKFKGTAMPK